MVNRKVLQDVVDTHQVPINTRPTKQAEPATGTTFLSKERRDERRAGWDDNLMVARRPNISGTSSKRLIIIFSILFLSLIVFVIIATALSTATVSVIPNQETVEIDSSIRAYKNPDMPQLVSFSTATYSDQASVEVKTSGTKYVERKATGKITVYNAYSKEPVRLIANTRFQSSGGLIFRTFTPITIPGQVTVNKELVPGQIEINVTADKPGQEYNVGQGDFSVPGLSNGPMAKSVYAKSSKSMSGGYKGDLSIVSDKDESEARSTLEGTLTTKLLEQARAEVPENLIFLLDGYEIDFVFDELSGDSSDAESGKKTVSMKGTLNAVYFNKEMLALALARREMPNVGDASVDISNWSELRVDMGEATNLKTSEDLSLRITGTADFVWLFDIEALQRDLLKLPKDDYAKVFLDYPSIDKAEVEIRPFWKRSFPGDPSRIKVEVKLGEPSLPSLD